MDGIWGALPLLLILLFFLLRNITTSQRNAELARHFAKIQKKRKSKIIALVHRQEAMGLLGVPVLRYIDLNDAEAILAAIRATPRNKPLELILHTPGGLVLPALQIARAIKAHPGKVTVFVPHYAMSGGTLIALAADEIILSDHAVLGPIDPQIGGLPAASVVRVAANKPIQNTDDYTLVLADLGAMAIDQLEKAARELLKGTVSENAAVAVAEQLSSGRWTHDYPIASGEARELGLNVSTEMPNDIMNLMELFPDTVRRTGSVRFVDEMARFGIGSRKKHPHEVRMTGYEPDADARHFSYGPWNPQELRQTFHGQPHKGRRDRD